jgi:putative aminopeptidase FrvX
MPTLAEPILPATRDQHLRWAIELTSLPTAAGHEQRVVQWIAAWCAARPELELARDPAGNLHVQFVQRDRCAPGRPIYFTAHMDHPAFVVERIVAPSVVQLSFRGGVMDDYFTQAKVLVHDAQGGEQAGTLTGAVEGAPGPFKQYLCELATPTDQIALGDVAVWDVGPAEVRDGRLHTLACDDLAALAAALAACDVLLARHACDPQSTRDVRLLFTRAEEIGFVGAIAAVKHETMPRDARVIALENSRSFAESPIHGGPIVRVGDRISVFSPTLTDAIAQRAEMVAGGASTVTASQKLSDMPAWKWQRKLMAGGACEASVFFDAGYEATCVCLPLGNYHNMADLDNVQAKTNTTPPRVAREFIGVDDYHGLVDLLVACGVDLPDGKSKVSAMVDRLWAERAFVLT